MQKEKRKPLSSLSRCMKNDRGFGRNVRYLSRFPKER